jgi:predicted AlkP superfamily phosphohydrolase/phosphomutase
VPSRVLVVGFDALDKDLLQLWAREGSLPAFARLLETATWGLVQNPPLIYAGGVWPSFSTGVSPARHGRFFRYQIPPRRYTEQPSRPDNLPVRTFWEALSRAGRKVAVVDVPHSALADGLRGVQIVDWSTHEPDFEPGRSLPAPAFREVQRRFGAPSPDRCDRTAPTVADLRALTDELLARIHRKLTLSLAWLEEHDWDLFTVVFCESHCVGHQCWSLHDPTHPAHDPALAASVGDPIAHVYRALDAALGRLLERAGDDTLVLVLASHGMGPEYNESAVLDELLRRLEGTSPPTPGALRRAAQSCSRQMPSALRDLALVRTARMRVDRWLRARMLARDRMRRSYFEVPHNHNAGAIRINLVGRERRGTVRPGHYDAVREFLRRELCRLVNPATNRPAVERVVFTSDAFSGPRVDVLPDLFVEWSRREPLTAISSPRIGTLKLPGFTQRTGDHSPAGLFAARARWLPWVRLRDPVAVTAFAPTIAHALGVTLDGVDSEPVAELVAGARSPA